MRLLPWRKDEPTFDKNPWGDEAYLSGWTPGLSRDLDLFATMASLARTQWELARWLDRLSRAQSRLAFSLMICSLLWTLIALTQLGTNLFHWW